MDTDMSLFMGHPRLGSIRLANILTMNTDMSVSMGTHATWVQHVYDRIETTVLNML